MSKASTIKGDACRFFCGIIQALRKPEQASLRVRESIDQPEQASLRVRESKDTTPPSASTGGWSNENEKDYFIMTQNVFVMSQHQDGTNIRGPFNAGTLLYMLENGQIETPHSSSGTARPAPPSSDSRYTTTSSASY